MANSWKTRTGSLGCEANWRKGGCAAFLLVNLSQPDQVRMIVPFVIETFGRLDSAFNNAATSGDNALLVDQTPIACGYD